MNLTLIAAVDHSWILGSDNKIPWSNRLDMQHFKETTIDNVVIMGRKTFESMGSKPLKDRYNIVLSKSEIKADGVVWAKDTSEALEAANIAARNQNKNIFVIGGAQIYKEFCCVADRALISRLNVSVDPDNAVFFPKAELEHYMEVIAMRWVVGKTVDQNFFLVEYERKPFRHD